MKAIIPAIMLALCACSAFPAAEMRLPANLQSYPGDPILGIDGWTHGRFKVDEYSGGYERSETRLVFADVFDRRAAHADFTIAGPYIDGYIDARCRMRERALRFDEISITARPMAYRCEFLSQGRNFSFHLELQESVSDLASALSRHERRGEIAFGGEILQIRSIHHLEGSPLTTDSPIGYRFEQDGRPIAALEINGTPRLFFDPDGDPGVRRTVAIAALALSLLWDPADSLPGEH